MHCYQTQRDFGLLGNTGQDMNRCYVGASLSIRWMKFNGELRLGKSRDPAAIAAGRLTRPNQFASYYN